MNRLVLAVRFCRRSCQRWESEGSRWAEAIAAAVTSEDRRLIARRAATLGNPVLANLRQRITRSERVGEQARAIRRQPHSRRRRNAKALNLNSVLLRASKCKALAAKH